MKQALISVSCLGLACQAVLFLVAETLVRDPSLVTRISSVLGAPSVDSEGAGQPDPDWASTAVRMERIPPAASPNAEHILLSAPQVAAGHRAASSLDQRAYALEQALDVHPRAGKWWIELGLLRERAGDMPGAEQALLQAARLDRQLDPAWSLTNFYFRQGNHSQFWKWAAKAAERTFDDHRPLLRLTDQVAENPEFLLGQFTEGSGEDGDVRSWAVPFLRAYLDMLVGQDRFSEATQVAMHLLVLKDDEVAASGQGATNRERAIDLVDRLIAAGEPEHALELWAQLEGAQFLNSDHSPTSVIADLQFEEPTSGHGFDWRPGDCEDVVLRWVPGEVEFHFEGIVPDGCVFWELPLPVRVRSAETDSGRLQVAIDTAGSWPEGVHMELSVAGKRTQKAVPTPEKEPDATVFPFDPVEPGIALLRLSYQRPLGAKRFQGSFRLRSVQVEEL